MKNISAFFLGVSICGFSGCTKEEFIYYQKSGPNKSYTQPIYSPAEIEELRQNHPEIADFLRGLK